MKRKSIIIATAVAAVVGAGALAFGTSSFAQPYQGGWGYMGPGMMGGYGPGPGGPGYGPGRGYGPGWMHGWMHGGYGPGWRGRGYGPCWGYNATDGKATPPAKSGEAAPQQTEQKLSVDDVKARMERWLAFQNNPRLKLGDVKEKDANTITADIVTVDNSLVRRFDIDRTTGFYRPDQGN